MASDGSIVLLVQRKTIPDSFIWTAMKLHDNGTVLWEWEDDEYRASNAHGVSLAPDGAIVIVGEKDELIKLDSDGDLLWFVQLTYEDVTGSTLISRAVVVAEDGSIIVAGDEEGAAFAVYKTDADGNFMWAWQNGTAGSDHLYAAALTEEGSVVVAGFTDGNWSGVNQGDHDFVAMKVDANGQETWRWQGGSKLDDYMYSLAIATDGSIVLGGHAGTVGSGNTVGDYDFVAFKLTADGGDQWSWKNGASGTDAVRGTAIINDTVILAGYTDGLWGEGRAGGNDFAAVQLGLTNKTELWQYQTGTNESDWFSAIGTDAKSRLVMAGQTTRVNGNSQGYAVFLDFGAADTPKNDSSSNGESSSDQEASANNTDVIVAYSVSVAVVLAILALSFWFCRKRKVHGVPVDPPGASKVGETSEAGAKQHAPAPQPRQSTSSWYGRTAFRLPSLRRSDGALEVTASLSHDGRHDSGARSMPFDSIRANCAENRGNTVDGGSGGGEVVDLGSCLHFTPVAPAVQNSKQQSQDSPVLLAGGDPEKLAQEPVLREAFTKGERRRSSRLAPDVSCSGVGIAGAVLGAAQQLGERSQFPGIAEAATLVSILVTLVTDNMNVLSGADWSVKRCRSMVMMLEKAESVLMKADDAGVPWEGVLLEDVHDAVADLVELIQTYKSKKRITQVVTSSLFQRRQEEAEAIIDRAISRLHLGLHLQMGEKLDKFGEEMKISLHQQSNSKGAEDSATVTSSTEWRSRRQRKLDQIEIPDSHVTITEEVLGRGGFGAVYLADYNGRNVAAKVMRVGHELGHRSGQTGERTPDANAGGGKQSNSFWREVEAMIRLRSPHTVNVYGAITSRSDRLVLVMELLPGGDLRAFLKSAVEPLPEEQARRIIGDICAGVSFLHDKTTVHGDIKSANVLFDGAGRAKIGDFGTSRWVRNSASAGLVTYTEKVEQGTHMSFAWAAPEVLNAGKPSHASDVYSMGIVMWEVLSCECPWANEAPRDIMARVFRGDRPPIPEQSPVDLTAIMSACWAEQPEQRPCPVDVMEDLHAMARFRRLESRSQS